MLTRPEVLIVNPDIGIVIAAFLTTTLLVPASPFLLPVLRKSRFAWLILSIASLSAGLGFWIPTIISGVKLSEVAFVFLLLASTLNFLGLATARLGILPVRGPQDYAGNRGREILPETGNPENLPK